MATYSKPINYMEMIPEALYAGFNTVWKHNRGDDILVAYLGTGVRPHWDLDSQILDGKNFTTDNGGDVTNYFEGGTRDKGMSFASLLCGKHTMDEYGVSAEKSIGAIPEPDKVGVAPHAKLIIGKTALNTGERPLEAQIAGLRWALDWVGADGKTPDIIVYNYRTPEENLDIKALIDEATSKGIIVIVPDDVGSSDETVAPYPSVYQNVITIGGINENGLVSTRGNVDNTFVAHDSMWGILYKNESYPAFWDNKPLGNWSERPLAMGVGAIVLMLQAYKEAGTPIQHGAHLKAELPKYLVPAKTQKNGESTGMGVLSFDKTPLPNVPTSEITVVEPEVIPNLTKPVVTVGNVTHDNVELAWEYTVGQNDHVVYQPKVNDVNTSFRIASKQFTLYNLEASTVHSVSIAVINDKGQVTESDVVSVTTLDAPIQEPTEPVIVPNDTSPKITAVNVSHNFVEVASDYVKANGDNVWRKLKRADQSESVDDTTTTNSLFDYTVQPATTYIYTEEVYNKDGFIVASNSITVTTLEAPEPEKEIEYVPVPGDTQYIYVGDGSGGNAITQKVENGVVKTNAGRQSAKIRLYSN